LLPGSALRTALECMLGLWSGLTVFLTNPWGSLDNNLVERQLRGTEVAALFYSLIETARLRGGDPGHYLLRAAHAAIDQPGTVTLPTSSD
jgi:transposase